MEKKFKEDDRIEALKASGTGMWRLEYESEDLIRFYGDEYMNMLLGVPDEMDPIERYQFFISHVYEEDMPLFMEYSDSLRSQAQSEVVYRYDHPKLGVIYVRCGGRAVSRDGDMVCYRGFHQNVTDTIRVEQETKNRLTKQAELYRSVAFKMMDSFSDATVKINLNTGDVEWFSFNGEEVDNFPKYDDFFKEMSVNVPEQYRAEFLANSSIDNLRKQLENKDTYTFSTFIHRFDDGELRRVTYWFYIVDDKKESCLSLYKDTTEDYMMEKQLALALQEAKKASEAKTQFLNNMSHDIRTPMNAIVGFTDLAAKNVDDTAKCIEYLDKIKLSSNHLLSLINDVLDMSRIESGRLELGSEICSIKELLDGLNTILYADAKSRGIDFIVNQEIKDEYIICDKLRLNQVLLNCASNSVKFTKAGGRVRLNIKQSDMSDIGSGYGKYIFTIEDTGIGMSEEFQRKIFEPFTREENNVSKIQGTGLGMAIVKNIVDVMQGTIKVDSRIGYGTKFTVTLTFPLADGMGADDSNQQEVDISVLDGKRVLLVEDNELNTEIAKVILEDMGMLIDVAEDGRVAINKVSASSEEYYDLILMDIQMPVMNGYDATRRIRQLDRNDVSAIPIVAMSANAFQEDKDKAKEAGMNSYLSKPVNIEEVKQVLSSIIKNKNN